MELEIQYVLGTIDTASDAAFDKQVSQNEYIKWPAGHNLEQQTHK